MIIRTHAVIIVTTTVFAGLLLVAVGPSQAQTADHPSCGPWRAKWAEVSKGSDLAAIDDVIGKIPALCPVLKGEIPPERSAAAKRIDKERADRAAAVQQQQAALEAARRANDPCLQARNDWTYAQNGSEATLTAYISGLPAACGMWKSQAQEKLDALVRQRQQVEQQQRAAAEQQRAAAQRIADLTAAAKATGLEGRWAFANNKTGTCFQNLEVVNGYIIRSFLDFAGTPQRWQILDVSGGTVTYLFEDGRKLGLTISGNSLSQSYDTKGEQRMVHCR